MDIIKQLQERINSDYIIKPDLKFECGKLKAMVKSLSDLFDSGEESFFLAGGAVTSTISGKDVNDLDIYPKNAKAALRLLEFAEDSFIASATEKSLYLVKDGELDINIILIDTFPTAESIFNSFDFTIVMAAYDNDSEQILMHKNYLLDLASRRLQFNPSTAFPLMSLFRANKYCARGFKISKSQYSRIALRTSQLNINSYEELEKHLGGMYGMKIKEIFKDTPFDLENVIDVLDTLALDAKFGEGENKNSEIIDAIFTKYFAEAYGDTKFYKYKDLTLTHVGGDEYSLFPDEIPAELTTHTLPEGAYTILYKNVKPMGDKFVSFHDNDFEYNTHSIIVPKPDNYRKVLYFSEKKFLKFASYSDEDVRVVLKAKVLMEDYDSGHNSSITVKACEPLEFSKPIFVDKEASKNIDIDLYELFNV